MRPDTRATIGFEALPVPTLDASAGWVLSQPQTPTTVFPWFPNLENFISGVRRCTKVHGGVLRFPDSPPLGRPVWPSRPCKTEKRSSFGKVLVKFSSAWSARPLGLSRRAPRTSDKSRQIATNRDIPGSGDSESVCSALTLFYQAVRFGAGSCPRVGGTRNSFSLIGSHVRSKISLGDRMKAIGLSGMRNRCLLDRLLQLCLRTEDYSRSRWACPGIP
jgi:hypothetical protein